MLYLNISSSSPSSSTQTPMSINFHNNVAYAWIPSNYCKSLLTTKFSQRISGIFFHIIRSLDLLLPFVSGFSFYAVFTLIRSKNTYASVVTTDGSKLEPIQQKLLSLCHLRLHFLDKHKFHVLPVRWRYIQPLPS
jgi:hypothetical protein